LTISQPHGLPREILELIIAAEVFATVQELLIIRYVTCFVFAVVSEKGRCNEFGCDI
jgi:hypothetical protein